ncbi:MAG TPA: hypothetical protein VFB81_12860, partial [Myxococcales bacterium]|nr:hypothetical protein [Myxococcales bacterium]
MSARAVTAALIAALAVGCQRSGRRASTIALADCQLASRSGSGRLQARCGTLQVPEDRARPE